MILFLREARKGEDDSFERARMILSEYRNQRGVGLLDIVSTRLQKQRANSEDPIEGDG